MKTFACELEILVTGRTWAEPCFGVHSIFFRLFYPDTTHFSLLALCQPWAFCRSKQNANSMLYCVIHENNYIVSLSIVIVLQKFYPRKLIALFLFSDSILMHLSGFSWSSSSDSAAAALGLFIVACRTSLTECCTNQVGCYTSTSTGVAWFS